MEVSVKQRLMSIMQENEVSQYELAKRNGAIQQRLSRQLNHGAALTFDTINVFIERFPDVDMNWLVKGVGTPYGNSSACTSTSSGVPYYNVDFIGGFDDVFNDQTSVPETNIVAKGFEKATLFCNISGKSMEPVLKSGSIIALREVQVDCIQYGEMYAVVMDGFRTIKILRKSEDANMIRFVPINPDFDEQDFERSRIVKVYEVLGCINKFF